MPHKPKRIQLQLAGKIFLVVLAVVYVGYLIGLASYTYRSASSVIEHDENTNPTTAIQYWTADRMRNAVDADQQISSVPRMAQGSVDTNQGNPAQQKGTPPSNGEASYPLSTVGKI